MNTQVSFGTIQSHARVSTVRSRNSFWSWLTMLHLNMMHSHILLAGPDLTANGHCTDPAIIEMDPLCRSAFYFWDITIYMSSKYIYIFISYSAAKSMFRLFLYK